MGQMEAFYAPWNLINDAFTMLHFCRQDPYFLEYNLVTPLLPLQQMIFKWIEHTFEKDQPHLTADWIKECDAAMKEQIWRHPQLRTFSGYHNHHQPDN